MFLKVMRSPKVAKPEPLKTRKRKFLNYLRLACNLSDCTGYTRYGIILVVGAKIYLIGYSFAEGDCFIPDRV